MGEQESRKLSALLGNALRAWTEQLAGPELAHGLEQAKARANEYGFDPFGFSSEYARAALAPFIWMYKHYFHVEATGLENVPQGRVLLVANHSGQLPFDAAMIAIAMLLEARPARPVRAMVERWVPTLPYVSVWMARLGQVVGTPENARKLLANEEAILVMPEGVRGLNKLWRDRYRLAEFGNGFMHLALETGSPIVPVSVVGAEEQAPALANLGSLAKLLGMPALPVTPTLLPLPLPSRYYLHFCEPLYFDERDGEEESAVSARVQAVKCAIQASLGRSLKRRKRVYF